MQPLADMAEQAGTTGADLRRRLDRAGRLPAVRSDQRKAKALEWLLDHVAVVDEEGKPVGPEVTSATSRQRLDKMRCRLTGEADDSGSSSETMQGTRGAKTCKRKREPPWRPDHERRRQRPGVPGPHRHRADESGRAGLRPVLPPAERTHHHPGNAHRRHCRQPDLRPDALPRVRGPGQGHLTST